MNKPFTSKQVRDLPKGYHITRTQVGVDDDGIPVFYPNRRQRNARITNRNKILQTVIMKVVKSRYQYSLGDVELAEIQGTLNNKDATFLIIKRKIFHSKTAFR